MLHDRNKKLEQQMQMMSESRKIVEKDEKLEMESIANSSKRLTNRSSLSLKLEE